MERTVKKFGTGAHVTLPREWEGERVIVKRTDEVLKELFEDLSPWGKERLRKYLEEEMSE